MDGRGGCCIARYAGGAYDKSKVDRIMLRFRPIAPKPAVGGGSTPEKNDSVFKAGRARRKYVRDNNKRCNNRKKRLFSDEEKKDGLDDGTTVVTLLPLLPEKPERKATPSRKNSTAPPSSDLKAVVAAATVSTPSGSVQYGPIWFNFNGPTTVFDPVRAVGSFVTVERVTEAYVDEEEGSLGNTDEERRKNLERDTCPGFISDGVNMVEWINEAYRMMIGGVDQNHQMVWLVTKERLPVNFPAFACRVRLQYNTCRKEKHSMMVPCDVWRRDGGGFAWRLDVKAALRLGR